MARKAHRRQRLSPEGRAEDQEENGPVNNPATWQIRARIEAMAAAQGANGEKSGASVAGAGKGVPPHGDPAHGGGLNASSTVLPPVVSPGLQATTADGATGGASSNAASAVGAAASGPLHAIRTIESEAPISVDGSGKPASPVAVLAQVGPSGVASGEILNRELQWLEFNRRVLHEAMDLRTPLLERVRFLEIFTANLDEFFMKRVGGLKRQIAAGVISPTADGLTPQQTLLAIRRTVMPMLQQQADCFKREIRPALAENGIHLLEWEQLSAEQQEAVRIHFRANIFPVLTPLAVDPGHPFPFISNLSDSLGAIVCQPGREDRMFARVKVPEMMPRWIRLESGSDGQLRFIRLIDVIRNNLQLLFPNMLIVDVMPFRLTRNADVEHDLEDADDLLELVEEELRQRRFERVVRLEHGPNPNPWILQFLMQELGLKDEDIYEVPGELDYGDLKPVSDLNLPKLRYEPWTPIVPATLADEETDIFNVIRNGDLLVHHPYESFTASVERFVKAAAVDPRVLAIKMTVYRTGDDSPFIRTLIAAAEARKQVVCLVELKARFDEERNIALAQSLERAGVHVVYGIVGLKTHTKLALVVRQDPDGIRCYAHIGTGNYNAQTAKFYTDLGLFTCDPAITEDAVELFHYLTGRSLKTDYHRLLVAPVNMKERFLAMIQREVAHHRAGRPAHITAKMNSLEDLAIIRALYAASQAGVPIDLIVRGFCTLKPGVPGLSETIRVVSIIGRFLEHSRIFHFRNGQADPIDGDIFIGSADWMYRNLQARVEAVVPILQRKLRERCWHILQIMLRDHRQAWDMQSDGSYIQRTGSASDVGTQQTLMNEFRSELTGIAAAATKG